MVGAGGGGLGLLGGLAGWGGVWDPPFSSRNGGSRMSSGLGSGGLGGRKIVFPFCRVGAGWGGGATGNKLVGGWGGLGVGGVGGFRVTGFGGGVGRWGLGGTVGWGWVL